MKIPLPAEMPFHPTFIVSLLIHKSVSLILALGSSSARRRRRQGVRTVILVVIPAIVSEDESDAMLVFLHPTEETHELADGDFLVAL